MSGGRDDEWKNNMLACECQKEKIKTSSQKNGAGGKILKNRNWGIRGKIILHMCKETPDFYSICQSLKNKFYMVGRTDIKKHLKVIDRAMWTLKIWFYFLSEVFLTHLRKSEICLKEKMKQCNWKRQRMVLKKYSNSSFE